MLRPSLTLRNTTEQVVTSLALETETLTRSADGTWKPLGTMQSTMIRL